MKALVSWEDDTGATHRWDLDYDERDPEARHFLEALQLHVRFKLDTFDVVAAEAADDAAGGGTAPAQ
jgi:hypothetical protein